MKKSEFLIICCKISSNNVVRMAMNCYFKEICVCMCVPVHTGLTIFFKSKMSLLFKNVLTYIAKPAKHRFVSQTSLDIKSYKSVNLVSV